ncbi:50S ribosomal protein L30e [Candidatus Micrarchaeota archaeon]|nr:50S ribosomal protein L30e [Candidatus Micrarchaeota archaeon]
MDVNKSLRLVVDTGKVVLGTDRAMKTALLGNAKLIVIASNMARDSRRDLEQYCRLAGIPTMEFNGTSIELGTVCGKPFPISALTVLEEGESGILKERGDAS